MGSFAPAKGAKSGFWRSRSIRAYDGFSHLNRAFRERRLHECTRECEA